MKQNPMYKFLFLALLVSLLSCGDDLEEENKKLKEQLNNKNQELVSKNQELVSKAQQIANEAHSKKVKAVMSTMIKIDGKLSTSNYAEKNGKIEKLNITRLTASRYINPDKPSIPNSTTTYQASYEDTLIKTFTSPEKIYTFSWRDGEISQLTEKTLSDNSSKTWEWQNQQITKEFSYNSLGKVKDSAKFTYNDKKQLLQRKASNTTYEYSYDTEGRVSKFLEKEGAKYPTTLEYAYDASGGLTKITSIYKEEYFATRIAKETYSISKVGDKKQISWKKYSKNLQEANPEFKLSSLSTRQYNKDNQKVYEFHRGSKNNRKAYFVYQGAALTKSTTIYYNYEPDVTALLFIKDSTILENKYNSTGKNIGYISTEYRGTRTTAPRFSEKLDYSYTYNPASGVLEKVEYKLYYRTSMDDVTPKLDQTHKHQFTYNEKNSVIQYDFESEGNQQNRKESIKYLKTYVPGTSLKTIKPSDMQSGPFGVDDAYELVSRTDQTLYTYNTATKKFIKSTREIKESVVRGPTSWAKEVVGFEYDSQTQAETKKEHTNITKFTEDGPLLPVERTRYNPLTKSTITEVYVKNNGSWVWQTKV